MTAVLKFTINIIPTVKKLLRSSGNLKEKRLQRDSPHKFHTLTLGGPDALLPEELVELREIRRKAELVREVALEHVLARGHRGDAKLSLSQVKRQLGVLLHLRDVKGVHVSGEKNIYLFVSGGESQDDGTSGKYR